MKSDNSRKVDTINDRSVNFTKKTVKTNDVKITLLTSKKEQNTSNWPYLISLIFNVSLKYIKTNKSLVKVLFLVKTKASSFVSTKLNVSCGWKILVFPQ